MKIWVIGKAIPCAKNSFFGNFELEQARMLQKHGEDVVYIADDFRPINSVRRFGIHKVGLKDISAYEVSFPIRGLKIPNCLTKIEPKLCLKLYEKVEEAEGGLPDIIHVHFPSIINAGVHEYYKKRGDRIVTTEHYTQVMQKNISEPYLSNLAWYTQNADAVIRELKKHYPGYGKTSEMFPLLKDKMGNAITNAEKLEEYHKAEKHPHPDSSCNPYTDVHKLVKIITQ